MLFLVKKTKNSYFQKLFRVSSNEKGICINPEQKQERIKKLKPQYEWATKLAPPFRKLQTHLLFDLLQTGIEINQFDFDLFHKYLELPRESYRFITEEQEKKLSVKIENLVDDYSWFGVHDCNNTKWMGNDKLIRIYLEEHVKKFNSLERFKPFLKLDYL